MTNKGQKSSYSAANSSRVEVGMASRVIGVRDTKDRSGGTPHINPAQ